MLKIHKRLRTNRLLGLLLFIPCLTGASLALAADETDPCARLENQLALTQCWAEKAEAEQAREIKVLNRLRAVLKADEKTQLMAELDAAEQAWVSYRDKHCGMMLSVYHGGSMAGMAQAACRFELSRARRNVVLLLLEELDL